MISTVLDSYQLTSRMIESPKTVEEVEQTSPVSDHEEIEEIETSLIAGERAGNQKNETKARQPAERKIIKRARVTCYVDLEKREKQASRDMARRGRKRNNSHEADVQEPAAKMVQISPT